MISLVCPDAKLAPVSLAINSPASLEAGDKLLRQHLLPYAHETKTVAPQLAVDLVEALALNEDMKVRAVSVRYARFDSDRFAHRRFFFLLLAHLGY
jgi:hypothetical protein